MILVCTTTEALGNGVPRERAALGIADNPRFTLFLEGIREGHQGASGGIRCPFCRASGASGKIRWLQNLGFEGHQASELGTFKILKGVARNTGF